MMTARETIREVAEALEELNHHLQRLGFEPIRSVELASQRDADRLRGAAEAACSLCDMDIGTGDLTVVSVRLRPPPRTVPIGWRPMEEYRPLGGYPPHVVFHRDDGYVPGEEDIKVGGTD